MLLLYFILLIVALIIDICLAKIASGIAADKGYEKSFWFWICFLVGFLGYLLVAAMPDLNLLYEQKRTNELLQKLLEVKKETVNEEKLNKFSFDDLPML